MQRFTNDGFTFEVTDTTPTHRRTAEDVVVLLHGFPQDRHCWAGTAAALTAAGYRVLAPDQRGYSPGARPPSRSAYTLSRLAGDVLALADAAGAERFHLVGHDWGGALAWHMAGHHADRMTSVTSLSVPHPAAFLKALTSSSQALRSWYMAVFQLPWVPELALARRRGEGMRRALVGSGLNPDSAARYAARAADLWAMRGPLNWYRAMPLNLGQPARPITVPTLFAWGDGDRFLSRAAAELTGRYVKGPYRFEVLSGASHWLPEEVPERVGALLLEHFTRASGG